MQNTGNNESPKTNPASIRNHVITRNDLPLSCPLPSANQWSAHPRVFLTLDENGTSTCPYCSTVYTLQDK
jgi:uncharacterized Zn-finger protein